jgi:hypothetical protein
MNYFGCNTGNCDHCYVNCDNRFSNLKIDDIRILLKMENVTDCQIKYILKLNHLTERTLKINKIKKIINVHKT